MKYYLGGFEINKMIQSKITWLSWLSVFNQNKHKENINCLYAGFSRLIPDKVLKHLDITKVEKEFCVIYKKGV